MRSDRARGRNERRVQLPEDPGHPVDRIIREAMAEGKFDHLEGQGRPLPVETSSDPRTSAFRLLKNAGFAPEWAELEGGIEHALLDGRAALELYRGQREAALAEIEALRRDWPAATQAVRRPWAWLWAPSRSARLAAARARLGSAVDALNASRDRALAGRLRRLHAINRMTDRLNLILPVRGMERCREDVDAAAREFALSFPRALLRFEADGEPSLQWTPGEIPAEWLTPPATTEEARPGRVRGRVQAEALGEYQRKLRASA